MWAVIYSTDFEPLTDGVEIATDPEFSAIEDQAIKFAEAGTKCCIQWSRDSDGQVAYWGPTGAMLAPHWYTHA